MNVMLFIIVLAASFVVVRIGAVAFNLTGLEWSLAKFQSLSCFSGTGFTTREAELITGSPQRRRIATILIVLGNAGLVTLIATLASALTPQKTLWSRLSESVLPIDIPEWVVPWVNMLIISAAVYACFRIFTNKKITEKLTNALRSRLIRKETVMPVSFEELLLVAGGYGISRIEVAGDSALADKKLGESGLRTNDITVLAIVRGNQTMPNPAAEAKILPGDELISFGRLASMRQRYAAGRETGNT